MSPLENTNIHKVSENFDSARFGKKPKKKRMAPLSVRLSKEQREPLEQDAMGMALNAYVLAKLFDEPNVRKRTKKRPTKRDKAVASALRRLGGLGLGTFITCQITALNEGRLILSDHEAAELRKADIELHRLRCDLMQAVGLDAEYMK